MTVPVADILPGAGSSDPFGFTHFNNELYFTANNGGLGYELWKVRADGGVGFVSDIAPGAATSLPDELTVYRGELYFSADNGGLGEAFRGVRAPANPMLEVAKDHVFITIARIEAAGGFGPVLHHARPPPRRSSRASMRRRP